MAYLAKIIRHLEDTFQIKVEGQYYGRTEIEGIRFLTGKPEHTREHADKILYIGDSRTLLPAGRPQNLLVVGPDEPLADPHILYIREHLDTAECFNAVQEVIFIHYTQKMKQEELFRSLHGDYGIDGMAHVAHTYLNNPVTICDTSFSVIAASPVVEDGDNLVRKHGRLYLKDALFQNMEDRNIIRHIYSSSVPYITALDDYPYKWVFESIRIRHAVVGYICVRGTVREFTEDDLEFIDVFSQMLSVEMQKDASYRHPTGLKYEYFLTELLEGHFDRAEYITSHLIQLGRTQMPYYTILLLAFTDPEQKPRQYKSYFEQLRSLLPNSMVVLFNGSLTVLLPGDSMEPLSETCKSRFDAFLQLNHMQAFISYPYTDIAKSRLYYQQVKELSLLYAKAAPTDHSPFVYYGTCFLEHCFSQYSDKGLLRASVHPAITQILEYDRASNTEYARTLRIYLARNRNALSAAGELHIHKSTFFYRLGKMADLFGIDVNDGLALFTYEYSFRVLDYLGQGDKDVP